MRPRHCLRFGSGLQIPKINSASYWAEIQDRSSVRGRHLNNRSLLTSRPACPPPCWSAVRTFAEAEQILHSLPRKSARLWPTSFPESASPPCSGKSAPSYPPLPSARQICGALAPRQPAPCFKEVDLWPITAKPKPRAKKPNCDMAKRILNAFREVSDALVSREQLAEIREHQIKPGNALETGRKTLFRTIRRRQSQLLRSSRSPTTTLSRAAQSRSHATRPTTRRRLPLQSARRRLAGRNQCCQEQSRRRCQRCPIKTMKVSRLSALIVAVLFGGCAHYLRKHEADSQRAARWL